VDLSLRGDRVAIKHPNACQRQRLPQSELAVHIKKTSARVTLHDCHDDPGKYLSLVGAYGHYLKGYYEWIWLSFAPFSHHYVFANMTQIATSLFESSMVRETDKKAAHAAKAVVRQLQKVDKQKQQQQHAMKRGCLPQKHIQQPMAKAVM
jgi:hypothetical protein